MRRRHFLRGIAGVARVEVDLPDGSAKVTHDAGVAPPVLIAAVESAGYEASVI